jgi:hypothetical protein
MARYIALARTIEADLAFASLRALTVCTCALALIAAGRALPF